MNRVFSAVSMDELVTSGGRSHAEVYHGSEPKLDVHTAQHPPLEYRLSQHSPHQFPAGTFFIKVGGSLIRYDGAAERLELVGARLDEFHAQGYRGIISTGGGLYGATAKNHNDDMDMSFDDFQEVSRQALLAQGPQLQAALKSKKVQYVAPDQLHLISPGQLDDMIPLVAAIDPRYIDRVQAVIDDRVEEVNYVPWTNSDGHTVVMGDYFGIYRVIFAKKAKRGVHYVDPNIGAGDDMYEQTVEFLRERGHKDNKKLARVSAPEILQGDVSLLGLDGRRDHIFEPYAARLFAHPSCPVELIHVVDGENKVALRRALEYNAEGKMPNNPTGTFITKS